MANEKGKGACPSASRKGKERGAGDQSSRRSSTNQQFEFWCLSVLLFLGRSAESLLTQHTKISPYHTRPSQKFSAVFFTIPHTPALPEPGRVPTPKLDPLFIKFPREGGWAALSFLGQKIPFHTILKFRDCPK